MRKIGITGGIGSGKSKVLDFLSVVCGASTPTPAASISS